MKIVADGHENTIISLSLAVSLNYDVKNGTGKTSRVNSGKLGNLNSSGWNVCNLCCLQKCNRHQKSVFHGLAL